MNKFTVLRAIALSLSVVCGCSIGGGPRPRIGSYPASSLPAKFLDVNSLGSHSYGLSLSEHNGLVYTGRGGHIDVAHLRIAADNTRFLYGKVRTHLLNNEPDFTFKLNVEPSSYYVELQYPSYWQKIPQQYREKIADKMALELSQYFTYTMTTWHEVLTWFGYKCLFFLPEESSAFSWEDIYSNLLGTRLGAEALEDKEHSYDRAMTTLLKEELENLQAQTRKTAKQAAREIADKTLQADLRKNTDIGLYDGFVTPTLAPGLCNGTRPKSLPVPTLDEVQKYGFGINLEIEPREFERNKILRIIYPEGGHKRVRPAEHLQIVMNYIEKDAMEKGYAIVPSVKPQVLVSAQ
ncbi:MAG: DUF4056 domain-containing protein [Planctomycetota bacterium]